LGGNWILIATAALLFLILVWRAYLHVSQRRRTEALQRYESLFRHNADGVVSVGPDGGILSLNAAFTELTGWEQKDLAGTSFVGCIVTEDRPVVLETLRAAWEGEPKARETVLRDRRGRLLEVKLTTVPIQVGPGVVGVYQIVQDIRLRKEIERKLETQALYDYLTGLPNRALFQDRLEHAVERARRPGRTVSLLYVDLDRFKPVNDTAGHAAGDEILKTVANRLGVFLRGGDTVARLGGDEFAVLLENVDDEADAVHVAERIVALLVKPIDLPNGQAVEIGGSVGVALATVDMREPEELVRQADVAMYEAKRLGGHRYHVYRPGLERRHAAVPLQLEGDLRRAIERDELSVAYQPIIDLAGTRIVGVEALARWRHPEHGLLQPSRFVPLAEETGLIVPLDRWVLKRACHEIKQLRSRNATNADALFLSVNYSKLHLEDDDSIDAIARILTDELFDPSRLQLEITETVAGSDRERLREMKELGVMLAIDDFGTGFSSLGYLQDIDVDVLKIDRSFVKALGEEQSSVAIVRTILTLASVLQLGVIIEGVEDSGQLRQLQELGGRYVQGFYFAQPMDFEQLKHVVMRGLPPEWVLRRNAENAHPAVDA
jgi:ammonium transporter, Amt family